MSYPTDNSAFARKWGTADEPTYDELLEHLRLMAAQAVGIGESNAAAARKAVSLLDAARPYFAGHRAPR